MKPRKYCYAVESDFWDINADDVRFTSRNKVYRWLLNNERLKDQYQKLYGKVLDRKALDEMLNERHSLLLLEWELI